MTQKDIDHIGWQYRKQGFTIVAFLFLMGLLAANVGHLAWLVTPLVVCAVYALVLEMADGLIWARVAKRSAEDLSQFFMAVSGFRMLSALAVMFVYYLVAGRAAMLSFCGVFAVFYVAIMVHHTVFFRKHSDISTDK